MNSSRISHIFFQCDGIAWLTEEEAIHRKFDQLFSRLLRKPAARNSLMAVDAPGKGVSWRGHADHLDRDSPFFIASCTKLYTTAIVLQLVEAGAFALEDPAHGLLPEGTMAGLAVINGQDHSRRITIGQLISNTSGLADYFEDRTPDGRSLFTDLCAGADIALPPRQALDRARSIGARFAPGAPGKAHYADTNFLLLGEIAEHATGQQFERLIQDRISARIGLTATYGYGPATADRYRRIVPISMGTRVLDLPNAMAGFRWEGGIVSTLDDSLAFLKAFMGGALFGKAWLSRMTAQWNPIFYPIRYGLGMMKFALHPAFTLFRRVPPLLGHSGSTGVVMYHCPERDIWLAGTINQIDQRSLSHQFMLRAVTALG